MNQAGIVPRVNSNIRAVSTRGPGAKSPMVQQQTKPLSNVCGILPPCEEATDLSELYPVLEAKENLLASGDGHSQVDVQHDEEIDREVVAMEGKASVIFPARCHMPQLVLFIKQTPAFFRVEVDFVDHQCKTKTIVVSNRGSLIRVEKDRAQLPVVSVRGWKYLRLDLADIAPKAFGTRYSHTTCIRLQGGLLISRIFFQDRPYSDAELPAYLRVMCPRY